ncbi:MAG: hypothetical protein ABSF45_26845 [Terriglobia bacterium]|jgi:hypothetical protein
MQVVLLRVGIDTGSGGIVGPVFKNGSFEYIPIPDNSRGHGIDKRTYGNTYGRHGSRLIRYFPERRREAMRGQSIHVDPEFETFTYGDPTIPKVSLQRLAAGSILVFYAGLKGWGFERKPALYIIGCFVATHAGLATSFTGVELRRLFRNNFHVKHREVFNDQKEFLVLVKGGKGSRLLKRAVKISSIGQDRIGRPIYILSKKMQRVFGNFDGHLAIQRSPPRWVAPEFTERASQFLRSLD